MSDDADDPELSFDELRAAAEGDLRIWAVVMFVGAVIGSTIGLLFGVLDTFSFAVALLSGATTSYLVWNRSPLVCWWVGIGYRFVPLVAIVTTGLGIALVIRGLPAGWLLIVGSIMAVPVSMVGLEILHRAEEYGVVKPGSSLF